MRDLTIAVTGGTGTFGQAFVRQILKLNPKQIRVISRDELKQSQMRTAINDYRVEYFLGDIRDYDRLKTAFRGVDLVVHAAALKRVEAGQRDPQEFIKTNVQGTINVANACIENNVKDAIFISSDKAVSPINVYGGSKFLAEQVWINSNVYRGSDKSTKLSVVRYGNVLGSRGSLIRIWQDQSETGSIKITDPRMTRFFLTITQAIDLVCAAVEMHQGGEIFIPQLKAVSILELAQTVVGDTPIEYIGNRGGEKLHESLVNAEEAERLVSYEQFSVINPAVTTWPYKPWRSEIRCYYESSEKAPKFTEHELKELIASII